jgi:hypothetical protein
MLMATTPARRRRRLWATAALVVLAPLVALAVADRARSRLPAALATATPPAPRQGADSGRVPSPGWPERLTRGQPAKRALLAALEAACERLGRVEGYTATFRKRERIGGVLGPEQSMAMKLRHRPFAVYLKYLSHRAGREVIYAEGRNENKLVAHNGGWSRLIAPRLALDPTDPLALAHNRHPVTEAGLAHLARSLADACRDDLNDPGVAVTLDRVTEGGRAWWRATQDYSVRRPGRAFTRVEVHFDPETGLPLRLDGYDWPEPGPAPAGDPPLGEQYRFENLALDAPLGDPDFDPDNPAYAFDRFGGD